MVFVIVAKLTAKGEAEADELLAIMTKAAASYRQDPGTLSWHIARGVKDKTQLVAFERASRVQATMLTRTGYESRKSVEAHTANPNYKSAGATSLLRAR